MSKTVVLYARVSSERQAQQSTIDSQIVTLRERAEQDGHVILLSDEYVDNGYSGSTLQRPALERVRDRIAEGSVDILYVLSPDRLARRHAHQVLLLEEFSRRGVQVIPLQGRSGETAEDQLLTQVQGVIAEYERAKIMERSRRGKLHKAKTGCVNVLSSAPYGYVYVKKTDSEPAHYQIVLNEAGVVRRIFEAVVRDQKPLYAVACMLNAEQVPTRRPRGSNPSARWQASAIHRVLCNPAYMGQAAYGKTESVERPMPLRLIKGRPRVPKRPKSASRRRPEEQWIRIAVPALVSAEMFAGAKAQLERNMAFAPRNRSKQRYLLSGLTVCARCGYGYYGRHLASPGRKSHTYYACGSVYERRVTPPCKNRGVRLDQLETQVWQSVCGLLQDPSRMMEEWSRRTKGPRAGHDKQLEEARRVVQSHERALQRLIDGYESGVIELADLTARSNLVRSRISHARAELTALEKVLADTQELKLVIGRIEEFAERVRAGLGALAWDEQQAIIRALIARIEIEEDDVTIVYRVPAEVRLSSDRPNKVSTGFVGCDPGVKIPAYLR